MTFLRKRATLMSKQNRHDSLVDIVLGRIAQYDKYTVIEALWDYHRNGYDGEVDVLAYNSNTKWWHFYEVKCSMTKRSTARAQEQYDRFKKAYPKRKVKGVQVTYQGVRRLKE